MFEFARTLTPVSACRYALWRFGNRRHPISLMTRLGAQFELRPDSFGNNDYGVAYEVFAHNYYNDPNGVTTEKVRLIVDMGANVGYSVLYYLHTYPYSQVIAFEPHPGHAQQVIRNLTLDGTKGRVDFHGKAAGASARKMRLTNRGSGSSLTESSIDTIEVEVSDVFPILERKHIDLLKMDMEGGEYEIMADARFGSLDIDRVVMEWHSRGGGVADKRWCEERLRALGYEIQEIFTKSDYGMFHARRILPAS